MPKNLYTRTRVKALAVALVGLFVVSLGVFAGAKPATAATSSNLNFQARLLTNTGAVVPDGNYNIEFKIYNADGATGSQGVCSGSCVWMETRTVAGSTSVQVIGGYFSVNLGSVTAFGSSINWDQPLWLTMRVGGTASSPSWDAEMQNAGHSIALTALPYAFVAAQLAKTDGSGNRGTLSFGTVANNPAIGLPDASGTVCLQSSATCGFVLGTASNFVQLAQGLQTDASSTNSSIAINKTGGTADIVQLQKSGSTIFEIDNSGKLGVGSTASASDYLVSITANGTANDSRAIDITQADTANEDSATISLASTANRGTISSGSGYIKGLINTVTPTVNLSTTTNSNVFLFGSDTGLVLDNASIGASSGISARIQGIGENISVSGSPVLNDTDVSGSDGLFTYGLQSTVNVSPTITGTDSVGWTSISGLFTNTSSSAGSAVLTSTAYGIQSTSGGNLTTTGSTSHYGGSFTVGGTATSNYGLYVSTDSLATNNYGLYIDNITAAANNYAIYSNAAAQSYFAGSLLVNTSSATGLQIKDSSTGKQVVTVDTVGDQLVLGTAGTGGINGKLVFNTINAGNTSISLAAASTGTSYSLVLPTTGPSLGQCLQNDGTTAGQLTFGPCGATGTFVNFAPSSVQGDSTTNNSIFINKTGASGNILELQKAASDVFVVANNGDVTATGLYNTNTFTSSNLTFGAAASASLQSASSQALNITGNATSLWQVGGTNQNLTIQTSGTGILTLGTAGAGTVNLGANNAATINIGGNNTTALTLGGVSLNGTITSKALGILNTLTGSATAPSDVIKTTTNSASAFQVQNSSGTSVFGVDTSANKAVLGQSNSLNGALVFQNSTNSNTITLNTGAAGNNYTLTLPTAAPAGGLCIETSTNNSSQLIFASCSNNNASIQEVNAWDANNTNTVSVSPSTIGNEIILTTQIPTSSVTVTNVTGGGVTTWSKVVANPGNGTVNRVELWVGTVTSTGSSTITVTYSSAPGAEEIAATEFTAAGVNASTSWGIESSSSQLNSTASTTITYPNMTAVNGSELYYGYAQAQNQPATAGSTSGFSYIQTSTQHNMITYNTSLSANASYQPTATQNSSGQSNTVAVVLTAFVTSTSINNTTSLQKANFYVQAASAGTVAGVLQAASSGTADIMDLRNSSNTNVLSVSSTGDVLIKPAASATAFQVQNGSGYSVLGVDTSGSQVTLGDATHLSGKITFKDSGDTNTISILAPSSVAATYSLTLPTNTPTAGLCLGTSPSNANQLIFASCATQVSAASITYINQWSNSGTSITTLADSPATAGNLLVLYSHATNNVSVNSISGGGVTNWTKVTGNIGAAGQGNNEMWRGVVTTTGAGTITVTYSAAAGANEIVAQEYTMGGTGGGTWAIDTSGTTTGSSATVNYPSLTPTNSSELYAGYAWATNTMSAGSTSGYTYTVTSGSKYTTRNTSVSGGVATQPTASQSLSGNYNSIAAVIQAYAGTSVIVNSTATQQANFNVQAPLSGTVAGVLQGASSGSADVLEVKDGSGNNVMTVNTSNINGVDGVTLGASNSVGGQLTFNSSGNSNSITLAAPTAPGASYTLTLPTTTPAAGQCLATSPSNANQLVFSSCANQVTSVAISFVNNWKGTSAATPATLSVSPTNVGDLLVLFVSFSKADTVNSAGVSGGGCGTAWSKVASTASGTGTDLTSIEMYRCQVVTTGASTISVTWSGPAGTHELAASEFTTGSTTGSWVVDSSNTQFNSTSTTTATWPSLTPQSSKDLYVGYGAAGGAFSGAVSSGYTYLAGSLTNRAGLYNTSVSATSQPTATVASSASLTVGALIAAYSSSSVISNSTVTQQGNFNIQAATSGSVAGTLQAFGAGTGDIIDLLDGAGTIVGSVGYSGNMLVRPSTASASAFQVQTTGSVNVLAVDSSGKQVVIGAGSTGESSVSLLVLDNRTGSSADPTGVNGAMYYNATTHVFRCYAAGAWQNCGGLLSSNTSQSSANNNCSNNCAAFSTFASIPANYCQAGRVIRLNAHGYFSSLASATNLQFGVYYGTDSSVAANDTLIGTLTPTVSVTSASNNYFGLDFDVTCFSTTSMQADGLANVQIGAAASGVTGVPISSTSPTTVVSTSAKNLYIFPVWGAASTSNTAKVTQFIVSSP